MATAGRVKRAASAPIGLYVAADAGVGPSNKRRRRASPEDEAYGSSDESADERESAGAAAAAPVASAAVEEEELLEEEVLEEEVDATPPAREGLELVDLAKLPPMLLPGLTRPSAEVPRGMAPWMCYRRALTPEGVQQVIALDFKKLAAPVQKALKMKLDPPELCLPCLDEGLDLEKCIKGPRKVEGGNPKSHFDLHIKNNPSKYDEGTSVYTLTRIPDYAYHPVRNVTLLGGKSSGNVGVMVKPSSKNAEKELRHAILMFVAANGLSYRIIDDASFRAVVSIARTLDGEPKIGSASIKELAISKYQAQFEQFLSDVSVAGPGSTILFMDDLRQSHFMLQGVTAVVVRDTPGGLALLVHAVQLDVYERDPTKPDGDLSMTSAQDRAKLAMKKLRALPDISKCILTVNHDGEAAACNAAKALLLEMGNSVLAALASSGPLVELDNTTVRMFSSVAPPCFPHTLNLGVAGALGLKSYAEEGRIPSAAIRIQSLLDQARELAQFLSSPHGWRLAQDVANRPVEKSATKHNLVAPEKEGETRWNSTYRLLKSTQTNLRVLDELAMLGALGDRSVPSDAEIDVVTSVLEPLNSLSTLFQTTRIPIGAMTLPMTLLALRKYNIGVIDSTSAIGEGRRAACREELATLTDMAAFAKEQLKSKTIKTITKMLMMRPASSHAVRVFIDGNEVEKPLSEVDAPYSDLGIDMVQAIAEHLVHRFVVKRANNFVLDVLAARVDPIASRMLKMAVGTEAVEGCFAPLLHLASLRAKPAAATVPHAAPQPATSSSDLDAIVDDELPLPTFAGGQSSLEVRLKAELSAFDVHAATYFKAALPKADFDGVVGIIKDGVYDPLAYWTQQRAHFPLIFELSRGLLAYTSSNALQESIFSIVTDTMGSRRGRLFESPRLLEATLALRVHERFNAKINARDRVPTTQSQLKFKPKTNVVEVD